MASLWELWSQEKIHHFKNQSLGMAFLHRCHLALCDGVSPGEGGQEADLQGLHSAPLLAAHSVAQRVDASGLWEPSRQAALPSLMIKSPDHAPDGGTPLGPAAHAWSWQPPLQRRALLHPGQGAGPVRACT